MSEIRFKCRQCPSLMKPWFDLPGVLQHWRWHTEQARRQAFGMDLTGLNERGNHYRRVSPAFTLTLLDTLSDIIERHSAGDTYYEPNGKTKIVKCYGCEDDWPCADARAVVTVVMAAGYEAVTE